MRRQRAFKKRGRPVAESPGCGGLLHHCATGKKWRYARRLPGDERGLQFEGSPNAVGLNTDRARCHSSSPVAPSTSTRLSPLRFAPRRFHIPWQALGIGYESYDLAPHALPPSSSHTASPPPQTVIEPQVIEVEPEGHSDQDVMRQPARRGMRICGWILLSVLLCIYLK